MERQSFWQGRKVRCKIFNSLWVQMAPSHLTTEILDSGAAKYPFCIAMLSVTWAAPSACMVLMVVEWVGTYRYQSQVVSWSSPGHLSNHCHSAHRVYSALGGTWLAEHGSTCDVHSYSASVAAGVTWIVTVRKAMSVPACSVLLLNWDLFFSRPVAFQEVKKRRGELRWRLNEK